MPVEILLVSSVSVQPEINRGIVPEPGQDVIEQKRPFIFSLQQQMTIVTEGVKSVRAWAESALGGFKAVVGRGSEGIRSRGRGRRPKCSRCRGRHYSAGECKGGLPGSVSSIFTSQLLTFSLTPQLI